MAFELLLFYFWLTQKRDEVKKFYKYFELKHFRFKIFCFFFFLIVLLIYFFVIFFIFFIIYIFGQVIILLKDFFTISKFGYRSKISIEIVIIDHVVITLQRRIKKFLDSMFYKLITKMTKMVRVFISFS